MPKPRDQVGGLTHEQHDRRRAADALAGTGLCEAVTLPLVSPADLERAGAPVDRVVAVANPLRAEESALRTRILPGLLRAVATNEARGIADVALFEIGNVFLAPAAPADGVLPGERTRVAAVMAGSMRRAPVEPDRPVDVYDAVDVVRVLLDALEVADWRLVSASPSGFHAGRTASVEVAGTDVGAVGELAASASQALGVTGRAVGFEIDLDSLLAAPRRDRSFVPISPYPPASIDLAFVVPDDVGAAAIASTLRDAGGELVEDVHVFDEFRSDDLGAARRSIAFRVRYRAPDRTLTDEQVGALRTQAIEAVTASAPGVELRA